MSKVCILDASAVLACVQEEPGGRTVAEALEGGPCWITAVNVCEVLSRLCQRGVPIGEAQAMVDDLRLTVVEFESDLAWRAAAMRVRTKPIGASLGDRACLALAERAVEEKMQAVVFTTDRLWATLKWEFQVLQIR